MSAAVEKHVKSKKRRKKIKKSKEKGLTRRKEFGIIEKRLTERALRKRKGESLGSRMGP